MITVEFIVQGKRRRIYLYDDKPLGDPSVQGVKMWILHDDNYIVAVVVAPSESAALDIAADSEMIDPYMLTEEEKEAAPEDTYAVHGEAKHAYDFRDLLISELPMPDSMPSPLSSTDLLYEGITEMAAVKTSAIKEKPSVRMADICPKPSDAVKAMIEGLKTIPNGEFKLKMSTYGSVGGPSSKQYEYSYTFPDIEDEVCVGCAATVAAQQAANVRYTTKSIVTQSRRARVLHVSTTDLANWEWAIDKLRFGILRPLEDYYNVTLPSPAQGWELTDKNYQRKLPVVENYLNLLLERGL